MIREVITIILAALVGAGWVYWVLAWAAVRGLLRNGSESNAMPPPNGPDVNNILSVTAASPPLQGHSIHASASILKPIKGVDADAYDNFASFCRQGYPGFFDIHFAVADPQDPAAQVVAKLQQDFPQVSIHLKTAPPLGTNPKTASLHALAEEAGGELLVISDAHIRVGADYLSRVVAPLADPAVGLVTCAYRGMEAVGLPARLATLHMSGLFLPAAALAHRMGERIGMGATLAMRRADLLAAGGFVAIADHLSDDYEIARLIEQRGLRTVLSSYVVGSALGRVTFAAQWAREVRWARGIRGLGAGKYAGLLVTWPIPWAIALMIAGGFTKWFGVVLGLTLLLRWIIAADIARRLHDGYAILPLLPIRECMSLAVWCGGAMGRRIEWRGQRFVLLRDGRLKPMVVPTPDQGEGRGKLQGPFTALVRRLDAYLRRRDGIFEFNTSADCVLRASISICTQDITLSDGTRLQPGDRLCDLHVYNEHVPRLPKEGAAMSWATQIQHALRGSLEELAAVFEPDPRFVGCKAVRAQSNFVTRSGLRQLKRMGGRLHFELHDPTFPPSPLRRLHDLGENLLIWALVRTFNPAGLRNARLLRERHHFYISRTALQEQFGNESTRTPQAGMYRRGH